MVRFVEGYIRASSLKTTSGERHQKTWKLEKFLGELAQTSGRLRRGSFILYRGCDLPPMYDALLSANTRSSAMTVVLLNTTTMAPAPKDAKGQHI